MKRHPNASRSPFVLSLMTCAAVTGVILVLSGVLPLRHSTALAAGPRPPALEPRVSEEEEGGGGPAPVDRNELQNLLYRAGLSPDLLAAAGIDSNAVSGIVGHVADTIRAGNGIAAADGTFESASQAYQAALRTLQSGLAGESGPSTLAASKAALASAASARQAAVAAVVTAATADLTQGQRALLSQFAANSGKDVPAQLRAVSRTSAQWHALRDALARERYCAVSGESLDETASSLLSAARAEATVSDAAANLQSRLSANAQAWNSAVTSQS